MPSSAAVKDRYSKKSPAGSQAFYPQQFRVASEAVTIIRQQYGIELPRRKPGNIAFHLVNGQSEGDDVAQTMQSVKMLKDIFNLVQYHLSSR